MPTGRNVIDAPMAASPRFGLRASIPTEKTPESVWGRGIAYLPEGCTQGEIFDPCDAPTRTDTSLPEAVEWYPYTISVSEKCSSFGGDSIDEGRAERLLNMDTERQIGKELWEGNLASVATHPGGDPWPNVWLAKNPDVDILSESGEVGFTHALACLEQYLADFNGGQQGVIHATVQTVAHWESFRLLRREGNKILTFKDTLVVSSPGYSGTSPDDTIGDNNIWAYATDMPRIFLGEPHVFHTYDREDNTQVVVAQRKALVEWQLCRHAGVRLAMDQCDVGGS